VTTTEITALGSEIHGKACYFVVSFNFVLSLKKVLLLLLPIALRPFQFGLGFLVVYEQFNFSGVKLLAPCPTPSYP
jgi:hypothetical protein